MSDAPRDDTAVDVPAETSDTPARRRARSRAYVARGWEWLKSRSIRCRRRGRYADGRPFTLRDLVPWQGSEQATIAAAEKVCAMQRAEALKRSTGQGSTHARYTLEAWRTAARKGRRLAAWARSEESVWRNVVRPTLGSAELSDLDNAKIDRWFKWCASKGYVASTQHRAYYLVRRVVKAAVEARVLSEFPWTRADLPAVEERGVGRRALSDDELQALARFVRERDEQTGGDLELRLATLANTGARPIEIARLRQVDVIADAESGHGLIRIDVRKQKKGKRREVIKRVPFGFARSLLDAVAARPALARSTGLIFPMLSRGEWRGRWSEKAIGSTGKVELINRLFSSAERDAMKRAGGVDIGTEEGLASFVPYMLRHTRLTELLGKGTIAQVQADTGHGSPQHLRTYMDRGKLARDLPESFSEASWPIAPPRALPPPDDEPPPPPRPIRVRPAREHRASSVGVAPSTNPARGRGTRLESSAQASEAAPPNATEDLVAPDRRGTEVAPARPSASARTLEQLALRWLDREEIGPVVPSGSDPAGNEALSEPAGPRGVLDARNPSCIEEKEYPARKQSQNGKRGRWW